MVFRNAQSLIWPECENAFKMGSPVIASLRCRKLQIAEMFSETT